MEGFFAYPANPSSIGETVERAISQFNKKGTDKVVGSWRGLDICGHFISDEVHEGIQSTAFLIADISRLNFNVVYEVGYAIGLGKRVLLVKNKSLNEGSPSASEVGIFDTLGYELYENSDELSGIINKATIKNPIDTKQLINQRAPIYLMDTKHKTDWAGKIVSRIKKAGFIFRTFDPNESPRLSAWEAIKEVSKSHGVIVPLLSRDIEDAPIHNMRCSFVAGLATGMGKVTTLLQESDIGPIPIDYRDLVELTKHPKDVDEAIGNHAAAVVQQMQEGVQYKVEEPETFLERLDIGSSSAENEMRNLGDYYLRTEQYLKALRGEANLIIGRKGSGKSALFLQIRDKERNKGGNIVLDLKPDGYKLIKFKELVLKFLEEGTFQHTIMAFWEYVLLLEICYKILESDKDRHLRDHSIYDDYQELNRIYKYDDYDLEGDFSERMSGLMEKISSDYRAKYGEEGEREGSVRLSHGQLTELIFSHDIRELSSSIMRYMRHKSVVWLLFDNVDKGWPSSGLAHEDVLIIRALIDAARKIERQFSKRDVDVNSIVFLRNDVYELLIKETADRGKDASVLLDWTDKDLLREIVRLRVVSNGIEGDPAFREIWPRVCVSHIYGEESSSWLIDRSLMRPRFLLNLINQCKGFAVNLQHEIIEETDVEKGFEAYATDLVMDVNLEIRDVFHSESEVLYAFIGSSASLGKIEVEQALREYKIQEENFERIIELLLWYGFLGIEMGEEEVKYIYDVNYSMQLLSGILRKRSESIRYYINPAFWPALLIEE